MSMRSMLSLLQVSHHSARLNLRTPSSAFLCVSLRSLKPMDRIFAVS